MARGLNPVQLARVIRYLEDMTEQAMESACTCVNRTTGTRGHGHRVDCTGVNITRNARAYLGRLKRKGLV